jgi:hypothetical protein
MNCKEQQQQQQQQCRTSGLRSALGAAHSLLRLLPTAFVRK